MRTIHHYDRHYIQYLHTLKGKVVASLTLRQFVSSMSVFFIPAFLYSYGYSLQFIAFYYVVLYFAGFLSYKLPRRIISRKGLYHCLFISYIFLAINNALLSLGQEAVFFVILSIPTTIIAQKCYWPARHIDVASIFDSARMTRSTSAINTISMFAKTLAPVLGGLLAAQFGPSVTLMFSFLIMLFAIFVLKSEYEVETGEPVKETFAIKKYFKPMIANAAWNFQATASFFMWPLFIFFVLKDFGEIGLIITATTAVGMLITYASGHWAQKFPYFSLGLIVNALSFPLRAISNSLLTVTFADSVGAVGRSLYSSRYISEYYRGAKQSGDIDSFVFSLERAGDLGKLVSWGMLLSLTLLGFADKSSLMIIFIASSFMAILMPLIFSHKNK